MKINFQNNIYVNKNNTNKSQEKLRQELFNKPAQNNQVCNHYYPVFFSSSLSSNETKAENFLNEIKYINGKIWVHPERNYNLKPIAVPNPEVTPYLQALNNFNLAEKKELIKKFIEMTGFPNPKLIKNNMENEAINAIENLAGEKGFKPLLVGYTNSCSVGKNMPLPGCDMDGLVYLIDTDKQDEVGCYRWQVSQKVNQRILATSADHLQEVLSLKQAKDYIDLAERIFKEIKFSKSELNKFTYSINNFNPNFTEAADFNMRIIKHPIFEAEARKNYKIQPHSPYETFEDYKRQYKYDFLGICMMLENYRQKSSNTILDNLDKNTKKRFQNSCLHKYSNITQQKALKPHVKDKLQNRAVILNQFRNMPIEEQFKLVEVCINNSFGIEPTEDRPYANLFGNSGKNTFDLQPLIKMYSNFVD